MASQLYTRKRARDADAPTCSHRVFCNTVLESVLREQRQLIHIHNRAIRMIPV
jgi:hypothetical protein